MTNRNDKIQWRSEWEAKSTAEVQEFLRSLMGKAPSARGVDFAGLLPAELQNYVVQTAGVVSGAKEPETARAFVKFLLTPEATAVIKAKGMERVTSK